MWNEFFSLLGDPAHWGFEVVTDVVFALLGAIALRVHDRRKH